MLAVHGFADEQLHLEQRPILPLPGDLTRLCVRRQCPCRAVSNFGRTEPRMCPWPEGHEQRSGGAGAGAAARRHLFACRWR